MPNKPILVVLEPEDFSREARRIMSTRYVLKDYEGRSVPDAKAVIGGLKHRLDEEFLSGFTSLKVVSSVTTGLNHVDLRYLEQRKIRLVSLTDVRDQIMNVSSTAEMALALILALGRRVVQSSRNVVDAGGWDRMSFFVPGLRGKTLGIVGYGRVGSQVEVMAGALGVKILAFDPDAFVPASIRRRSLPELLEDSDIITLHADYRGSMIFGLNELRHCKKGAMLINTARGELVDEDAIAQAIGSQMLSGYAADVATGENSELWELEEDPLVSLAQSGYNVILTPHLGGCTTEAFEATQKALAHYLVKTDFPGIKPA